MTSETNVLYCNNTDCNLVSFHKEIAASLLATGTLPEELADLFIVTIAPVKNADGSPRFIIDCA